MAYSKLVEDLRIDAPAPDDAADEGAYIELQDQLRGVLKARTWDVTNNFIADSAGNWAYSAGTTTGSWQSSTANAVITAPLDIREGEKITAFDITMLGNSAATGGLVELQERQLVTVAGNPHAGYNTWASIAGTSVGGANPWNLGNQVYRITTSSLSIIAAAGYVYRVCIQKSNDGVAASFGNVTITSQFGN
jgi:hypothetical protein